MNKESAFFLERMQGQDGGYAQGRKGGIAPHEILENVAVILLVRVWAWTVAHLLRPFHQHRVHLQMQRAR
jgi:hypothetical protein